MSLKILIVKTSAIGDVIHTLPVVDYLKKRFPDAEIDWAVEKSCYDFLSSHLHLNRVYLFDFKKWRKAPFKSETWEELRAFFQKLRGQKYDLVFDFQGNTKSSLVTYFAKGKEKIGFGWKTLAEKPNYFVTYKRYEIPRSRGVQSRYLGLVKAHLKDEGPFEFEQTDFKLSDNEKERLSALIEQLPNKPRLMVAFGSNWKNKRLEDETLKAFLQEVNKSYAPSFFFPFGNAEEWRLADELAALFPSSMAIGKLSLPLWQALMAQMDGVIAMDSAALHLCGTTKTPTFSFFGPSSSAVFKPEGEKHAAFQGSCPYGRTFEERCPILRSCPTGACLREADLATILLKFHAWWRANLVV